MTDEMKEVADLLGQLAAKHFHEVLLPEAIDVVNGFTREEARERTALIEAGVRVPMFPNEERYMKMEVKVGQIWQSKDGRKWETQGISAEGWVRIWAYGHMGRSRQPHRSTLQKRYKFVGTIAA